jgi:membrane protein required for colicin V production
MVWIDGIIGLLFALELIRGWKKGFADEIGTIAGMVLGFLVASACGNTMARFLAPVCDDSIRWSNVLAFLLTFLAVFLLMIILSKIFEGFLKVFALDWMNRLAGSLLFFVRVLLIVSVVLNLYQTIDRDCSVLGTQRVKKSVFYRPVRNVASTLFPSFGMFKHPDDPCVADTL